MSKSQSTELVTLSPEQFPILAPNAAEVIQANMGGEQITPEDLIRVRVPAGGATTWSIPTIDGTEDSAKEITGVIIHIARRRAYWPDANPSGNPPACSSNDCITGIGDPGGACAKCQFAQRGSAIKPDGSQGRGQACKERKLLFLAVSDRYMPIVIVAPAGSLGSVKQYQLGLGSQPYWSVLTRLTLDKVQNKDGIAYAQIRIARAGVLDKDTAQGMLKYAQTLQSVFANVGVDHDDQE